MNFERTPRNGTITEGGKACSISSFGTVLCDRPIQRNTGLHEAEFKRTSGSALVMFGMASATADLEKDLGKQKGSAGLFTTGLFYTDGQRQGDVGSFGQQEPVTLAVDTDVAGALECVWSVGGSERKRHPIEEGWRFAVGSLQRDASFEIVRYTVTARATDVRRAPRPTPPPQPSTLSLNGLRAPPPLLRRQPPPRR